MKLFYDIDRLLEAAGLPKGAKVGKKYKKVLVDGETFKDMTLKGITNNELKFSSKDGEHTFNFMEQEIILK